MSDSDTNLIERDRQGRFLSGVKPGPGRPKGSRNRHSENFLTAMADDFEQHGAAVIEEVRTTKPDVYLRIAADLLPRDFSLSVEHTVNAASVLETFRSAVLALGNAPPKNVMKVIDARKP